MSSSLDAIMAQLGMGGGGGVPGGDPSGGADPAGGLPPDPSQAPPGDPSQGGGPEAGPIDLLKQMIDLAKQYIDSEPDQQDVATMTDVLSKLQQYLAKDQAEQDGALQGKVSPRQMRKAMSSPSQAASAPAAG